MKFLFATIFSGAIRGIRVSDDSLSAGSLVQEKAEANSDSGSQSLAKAEAIWEANRRKTDELLSKVHEQMAALQEDISKTQKQQKDDMAALETARKKEDADIQATEEKLKALAHKPLELDSGKSSFLEGKSLTTEDILAPLKKAAEEAKRFSQNVRAKEKAFQEMLSKETNSDSSSFLDDSDNTGSLLEEGKSEGDNFDVDTSKADKSLAAAQAELNKLSLDIAQQKKELETESKKAEEDHAKEQAELAASLKPVSLPDVSELSTPSFVQVDESKDDPLSPASLVSWKEKFEDQLHKALDFGKDDDKKEQKTLQPFSLVELGDKSESPTFMDEGVKASQREADRLKQQFDEQMAKLREDNQKLIAHARAEVERSKQMKEELEAEKLKAGSFMQTTENTYDPAKAEQRISELEAKWKASAAKLSMSDMTKSVDDETNSILEQAKARRAETTAKLDHLREQLNKDIEKMHTDIAKSKDSFKHMSDSDEPTPVSFVQEDESKDVNVDTKIPDLVDENTSRAEDLVKNFNSVMDTNTSDKSDSSLIEIPSKYKPPAGSNLAKAEAELDKLIEQLKKNPVETFQRQFGKLPFDRPAAQAVDSELSTPEVDEDALKRVRRGDD